jgi:hypothetical protein
MGEVFIERALLGHLPLDLHYDCCGSPYGIRCR